MNFKISKNFINVLVLSFGSTWLFSVISFLGFTLFNNYILVYTLSISISIGLFPYLYVERLDQEINKNLSNYLKGSLFAILISFLIAFAFNYISNSFNFYSFLVLFFQYLTVAICEELLFRYYLQNILEKFLSFKIALILQSLLFAFLLHSGLPNVINLVFRLPSAICLTLIFRKSKNLSIVCFLHFLYDISLHIFYL